MTKPWPIAVFASMLVTFGQPKLDRPAKPVTVCEVLGSLRKYSGKDLAILGRLDCGMSSLIDHTCFLAEDQCGHPVTTKDYVWPNTLFLERWDEGMPRPPSGSPQIDEPTLIRRLAALRKTTKLGVHKEIRLTANGDGAILVDVKDEWGVAYGRVFSAPKLQRDNCDADEVGCNGFLGAPAVLIVGSAGVRSFGDKAYPSLAPQK